jgi:hypothetical protein
MEVLLGIIARKMSLHTNTSVDNDTNKCYQNDSFCIVNAIANTDIAQQVQLCSEANNKVIPLTAGGKLLNLKRKN